MKKLLFYALSGAILLSSCTPEDVVNDEPATGDYTFNASITPTASFAANDQIAVSAYTDATYTTEVSVAENVLYTYKDALFQSDDPIGYTQDVKLAFRALYPYSSNIADTFTFQINADQSSEDTYKENDLMIAKAILTSETKPSLNFKHCLSQIIIKMVGIDEAPKVSVLTSVDCDIASGTYTGTGTAEEVTLLAYGTDTYRAIIAPQTLAEGSLLTTLSINGETYPITTFEDITFSSGVSYTFNGEVTEQGDVTLVFSDNTWDEVGEGVEDPDEPEDPEEPQEDVNELIWDGDFESGEISQVTTNYSVSTSKISADGEGYNGKGHSWVVSNSEVRSVDYLAQFAFFLNTTLTAGDVLKVSFDVRSDNGSEITGLGMGISVDPYHVETIVLEDGGSTIYTTTEWTTASYDITITETNSVTEKLTFSIGNSADNFYLDNVSVILEGEGGSSQENEIIDPNCAAVDFVKNMGVGWNLGNSLDAIGSETAWGNPTTTQSMINYVADKGFKTLRVPTTWYQHLSSDGLYTIDSDWMDRVEEVVNYGINNDMYVILDIHHDEEIIVPSYDELDESIKIVTALWTQISERFKNYDDKLIFESLNEMRVVGSSTEWSGGDNEGRDCVNQLHNASLTAIRGSGGNNATRKVMLSPYAASNNSTAMKALEIPEDDDNIIVSIHSYSPYEFCMNTEGTIREWGSTSDKVQLDNMFWEIYELFVAKGIPVIMGEWGSITANTESERAEHAEYYAQAARDHFICPIVWDDGGNFQILYRNSITWRYESIADAIVKAN